MADGTRCTSAHIRRRIALLASLLLLAVAGCVNGRAWNPLEPQAPPVLSMSASAGEVVAHLNGNIERCSGWRAHNVSVKSNNHLLSANATVAVESPRNFRMLVSAAGMDLADLGSNPERMWFWVNEGRQAAGGQYAYTCAYQDLPQAQAKMGIPFRPNWLMEVMGVMPLDPNSVTMRTDPGNAGYFLLESEMPSADGKSLVRRIKVDAQTGTIVSHALADGATGRPLAEARMSDHRSDAETGIILPHRVTLSYPGMDFELTMVMDEIEINPGMFPATTWQPTVASAYPFMDILTERVVTLDQAPTGQAAVPWDAEAD